MKNKNVLVWLLVALAVVGAVAIGYTYRGTFLQGKMGPISGACDGKGCPVSGPVSGSQVNDAINRAEFAKLLAAALDEPIAAYQSCFSDVESTAWYTDYVCFLAEKDIMKGYADGSFGPAKKVNRAEAAKILMNAYYYSVSGSGNNSGSSVDGLAYTDVTTDTWYYSAVMSGSKLKLFDVKPFVGAKFYPGNYLSKGRAQLWIKNFKNAVAWQLFMANPKGFPEK